MTVVNSAHATQGGPAQTAIRPPRPNKHCTGPLIPHRRLRTGRSTSLARHRQHHITGSSAAVVSTDRPRTACRSGSSASSAAAVISTGRSRTACRSGSSAGSAAAGVFTVRPRTVHCTAVTEHKNFRNNFSHFVRGQDQDRAGVFDGGNVLEDFMAVLAKFILHVLVLGNKCT